MAQLRIMSPQGDKVILWDPQAPIGDADAAVAVREAERIFNEERARGSAAFKTLLGQPAERLDAFDENVEEIVIVPRIAGG